jgi:hypothetical protein
VKGRRGEEVKRGLNVMLSDQDDLVLRIGVVVFFNSFWGIFRKELTIN